MVDELFVLYYVDCIFYILILYKMIILIKYTGRADSMCRPIGRTAQEWPDKGRTRVRLPTQTDKTQTKQVSVWVAPLELSLQFKNKKEDMAQKLQLSRASGSISSTLSCSDTKPMPPNYASATSPPTHWRTRFSTIMKCVLICFPWLEVKVRSTHWRG